MADDAPGRGERGSGEPEGPPLAKVTQLKKVTRVRQQFPEVWIWMETEAKYMKKYSKK